MGTIYFTVGLPRSGKTTFRSEFIKHNEVVIISADELRYLIYGQRFFANGENFVWGVNNIMLEGLLSQGKNVFVDECGITKDRRKNIIRLGKKYKYKIICFYFDIPKEVCIERANKENDDVILSVIERMNNNFEKPDESEGIDKIVYRHLQR